MAGFTRQEGKLTCDGADLGLIAEGVGTPVYVYSRALVEENYLRFDSAFSPVPHLVCYAAKANSNLAVLRHLASLGAGADVVSGGELRAALESGFPAERIVFSGVGKTDVELRMGVEAGVLALNAESERELAFAMAAIRLSTLSAMYSVSSLPRPTPVGPTTRAAGSVRSPKPLPITLWLISRGPPS